MPKSPQQHRREVWDRFWDQNQRIEEVYSNSDRVLNQIRALQPVAGRRILEVGAGSGRDSLALRDDGAAVFVLDYSEPALRVIQQLVAADRSRLWLIRGDAFHLPVKSGAMDLVFHQGLLEHFVDPSGIVRENQRVLKEGGFALADVPQRYHLYTAVKHLLIWLNRWFAGWETEFSLSQLRRLFAECGLEVHSVYGDWMRPSFFYRVLREVAKKIGWRWPLSPASIPPVAAVRRRLRERFRRSSLAYYTYMDIGIIGQKE
jgi:SAM-dependent methyltransferase